MVGTIRVAKVNIQEQKLGFQKVGPAEDVKLVRGNTDEKVIFVGEVRNAGNKTLEINQIALTGAEGSAIALNTKLADVSLHLADGETSSAVAVSSGAGTSIDSITKTIEPGKSLRFELRAINNPTLNVNDYYRLSVMVKGMLEGNQVSTTMLKTAYVRVNSSATTTVVGNSSAKNTIVVPGQSTEIGSFNYNVKNDSTDITEVVLSGLNFGASDLDDVSIRFGNDFNPSVESVTVNGNDITVKLANILTLPAKNYQVKVFANFSESAVNGTKKELKGVRILNGTDIKGTGDLSYGHYVAKAYPILALKEKNTNSGNERLDLNVTKNTDNYKVVLDAINATANGSPVTFNKVSGTPGAFATVELSKDNAEVARATVAKTAVQSVNFTVTDDNGHATPYTNVDASNIADFASLAL
jgi:hypothetical protein